ncbi:MAG: hypothetical protein RLZZ519_1971 [Bacteroidota bacterium]|jgi:hypothetical protein
MTKTIGWLLFCVLFFTGGDHYIVWDATRKLTWEDFAGPADMETSSKAYTWSKISMGWDCEDGVFKLTAVAKFDKNRSWKKDILTPALLMHEQLHFDITELYARKMRAHFAALPKACDLSTDEVKAQAQQILDAWNARQLQYDEETRHSKEKEEQIRWELLIAKELKTLSKYAAP